MISSRDHQLTIILPPNPTVLEGDVGRLTQVFANLLINAAKFTARRDHPRISARAGCNNVGTRRNLLVRARTR
jgi:signal transduction histidine kinase